MNETEERYEPKVETQGLAPSACEARGGSASEKNRSSQVHTNLAGSDDFEIADEPGSDWGR